MAFYQCTTDSLVRLRPVWTSDWLDDNCLSIEDSIHVGRIKAVNRQDDRRGGNWWRH